MSKSDILKNSTSDFINVRPFMAALSNCVGLPYYVFDPHILKKFKFAHEILFFFLIFCFYAKRIQLHLVERLRAFSMPREEKIY